MDVGSASELINVLRSMAPLGKENPWNAILDSLGSLFDEKANVPGGMVQYMALPDRHHDLTKTGRTLRIGNRVQFIMPTKKQGKMWTGK